ncbi:major head protein [Pseudomonas phage NP1]|uniref:Major head protein n=2 Tax=Nipunavirus TaxID=1982239 RepID=A0A172PZT7_9CAUD|nr:major head protein [Pseudomonas phage NP1]YP_010719543.1 major head protein [Xanthomonas phage vB_Xar_IVIA-DoCa3]AND74859.1 major head protein [Pseudomonas phage NP1]UUW40244.1 major head protein [Xanthomonas phage vB_Xar_IVIA-DoCa3]
MASGVTRIADVVVPEIFSPYVQQMTQEKSRLIRSGAITLDAQLNSALAGGGLTFNEPSFKDLDNDAENVSTDDPATDSTPNKIGTATEIQVRLSRNNSWSSMDLSGDLAGADPMQAIANRVSDYWTRRQQAAFVATLNGVFADNAAAPTGTEHVQNDMTHDVSGASFVDGVTNFSAEAFIDATATMGDSMEDLTMVMVHSIVYARMLKNNLIDFVSDSVNGNAVRIPTFLGREVIVDDGVPRSSGVFNTWLFGRGAVRGGMGSPKVPTEVDRKPAAGNGGGQDILFNRTEWIIHPVGHAYAGTPPNGGPSNASTTNNLAHADSWKRVFSERKQIRIARLITREF